MGRYSVLVLFALFLAACGAESETTEETPNSAEDLLGVWSTDTHHLKFSEDGIIGAANSLTDIEQETFFAVDEYTLDGNSISFTGIEGYCAGLSGEYLVTLTSDGMLLFEEIREDCSSRDVDRFEYKYVND